MFYLKPFSSQIQIWLAALFISFFFSGEGYASQQEKLVQAALKQTHDSVVYDPTYSRISYPGGDVPADRGVCSDVIVRAYRAIGLDLQKLVHEDMKKNFSLYPKLWGMKTTDTNIDHRRVPNLQLYFKRQGAALPISDKPQDYKPGDIVTWNLKDKGSLPHIGIVVDRYVGPEKRPMVVHNIGRGPECEDMLFSYKITGHYRFFP